MLHHEVNWPCVCHQAQRNQKHWVVSVVKDTDRRGGAAAAVTHWNDFPQKYSNIFSKSTSCWRLISGLSGSGLYCDRVRETVPSSVRLYSLVRWKPQTWPADNMSYKPKFYCKHVMYYMYLMVLCVLWANNSCHCKSKIMLYIHKAIIQLLVFLQLKLEFTSQQFIRSAVWLMWSLLSVQYSFLNIHTGINYNVIFKTRSEGQHSQQDSFLLKRVWQCDKLLLFDGWVIHAWKAETHNPTHGRRL